LKEPLSATLWLVEMLWCEFYWGTSQCMSWLCKQINEWMDGWWKVFNSEFPIETT
jgi:hypothetical protein